MNGMEINVVRGIDRKEIVPYIINKGRLQMNINKYVCYIVLKIDMVWLARLLFFP